MQITTVELTLDVGDAFPSLAPASIAATVVLPPAERLPDRPVVCFARPGAGFTRKYFTCDLPGPARGSQARWHAENGWIFVALDHPGVGGSSPQDASQLTFSNVAQANVAAEHAIMELLRRGKLHASLPRIENPVRLGLGQSMGGCLTVIQAALFRCYDGIAVLGYGAYHTHPPVPPGETALTAAWRVPGDGVERGATLLNEAEFTQAFRAAHGAEPDAGAVLSRPAAETTHWHFYREDVQPYLRSGAGDSTPEWISPVRPALLAYILTPGIIAPQAAAVDVPVLVGMGDRDVVVDPRGEPRSYLSSPAVDLYICPQMGHMHNFAGTRKLLWKRIAHWGDFVAEACALTG